MVNLSKLAPNLVDLKANPGKADINGIRYIPELSGFIQPAAETIGSATRLYSSTSAVDTEFPNDKASQGKISIEAQSGAVSSIVYFGICGWTKDGSPQREVVDVAAADSTTAVDSAKSYGFIPAKRSVTLISKTDTNNRAFEILNADDEEIGYIATSSNANIEPRIVVPPYGFAVINHFYTIATAAQNVVSYIKSVDMYNDTTTTLYTSATLNSGSTASETFLDFAYPDEVLIIEGGKYGKSVYIDGYGDNASSAMRVEMNYDLYARWFESDLDSMFADDMKKLGRTAYATDHQGISL